MRRIRDKIAAGQQLAKAVKDAIPEEGLQAGRRAEQPGAGSEDPKGNASPRRSQSTACTTGRLRPNRGTVSGRSHSRKAGARIRDAPRAADAIRVRQRGAVDRSPRGTRAGRRCQEPIIYLATLMVSAG